MKYLIGSLLILSALLSSCGSGKKLISIAELRNTTTLILVRHAEKAEDGTSDPVLTPLGRARAQRLAAMLAPAGVSAVYSTPYKRTRLTAQPLAEQEEINLKNYDPRDSNFPSELIRQHPGETILVVGHSNTIPMMVNTLTGSTTYEQLEETEYDKLFVVSVVGDIGQAMLLSY